MTLLAPRWDEPSTVGYCCVLRHSLIGAAMNSDLPRWIISRVKPWRRNHLYHIGMHAFEKVLNLYRQSSMGILLSVFPLLTFYLIWMYKSKLELELSLLQKKRSYVSEGSKLSRLASLRNGHHLNGSYLKLAVQEQRWPKDPRTNRTIRFIRSRALRDQFPHHGINVAGSVSCCSSLSANI